MTQLPPSVSVRRPTGFAIAAFVLGLCGLIPVLGALLGLLAVIFGLIALTRSAGCGRKGLATAGLIIGAVTMIAQPILLVVGISHMVELRNQARCQANLNFIGKSVMLYQAESRSGQYPENIETLIRRRLLPPTASGCPSARKHGRQDRYFYSCPKSRNRVKGTTFLICDLKDNHPDGRAVGNISGQVLFFQRRGIPIAAEQAGKRRLRTRHERCGRRINRNSCGEDRGPSPDTNEANGDGKTANLFYHGKHGKHERKRGQNYFISFISKML